MITDPVLLHDWHPVAHSIHLRSGKPHAARLLDHDIVLWRDASGSAHVWQDLCVHRGARLSLGRIENSCVICPYHGWQYDASGRCVHIPAHPEQPPPARARANTYRAEEKYGLVWATLGEPQHGVPAFDESGDPSFRVVHAGPYHFHAHAPRVIENFLDVGHFPFVHAGFLGDPERTEIEDYEVETTSEGIVAKDIRVWQPDPDGTGQSAQVSYTYKVLRPFTAYFVKIQGKDRFSILCSVTPVGERESLAWFVMALNYSPTVPDIQLRGYQDVVAKQDIPIVESQRPELLPLDLQAELHLRSDRTAIAYRQWLKRLGLRFGTA
ncbi:MAG TPA: aromatic ring-hydroxylating dioxygenase subunit alpha [Candidatus Acidoferrum sp.]|nr:aromatic ring-hydroxylating dioxygenase subunit alpha [Candidatus Acidoferrum sp.]